jgi:PadR family transcriptional regulator PadR
LLNIEDGSLYPALHRLEKNGLVRGEWRKTASARRARFYAITKAGEKRLTEAAKNWTSVVRGVQRVMRLA